MGYLKVTAEELSSVSGRLDAAAVNISGENTSALGLVQALVAAEWNGAASAQFNQLFSEWKSSADTLLSSLEGISRLLSQAGTAYAETESNITRSLAG